MRLVPGARRIGLVVAHDRHPGSPVADDLAIRIPSAATTVWAHDDGSVLVRATFAPPAPLVPADPARPVTMVPQVPGDPGQVHLARLVRGDDASATDHRLHLLRAESDVALLSRLLRHAPAAGGAVLTRTSEPPPSHPPPLTPQHATDRRTR